MTSGTDRARSAPDPTRWLSGLDVIVAVDLAAALDEIAERVHELFPVDLVAVELADELDPESLTHGYCLGPSAGAQALAPLLAPEGTSPIGIGEAARRSGRPVIWPHVATEPAEIAQLGRVAGTGGRADAVHRLLLDASGVAVPFGTVHARSIGAVSLVSLTRDAPAPGTAAEALLALAPQIALIARNHQLATRNRRNRRTLEGVISSSPMGVIVADLRGRLSLVNEAAGRILGVELGALVGSPIRQIVQDRVMWRFINPGEFAARILALLDDPGREAVLEAQTVDGRMVEFTSSPVRDPAGGLTGRVAVLHDVTAAHDALAEARWLASERAALLEREERRTREEMGLARAAHMLASAVTEKAIGERLLEHAHLLVPHCEKSALLALDRRGRIAPVITRGFASESIAAMDFRLGEGVVGRAVLDRRPFICNDTELDARISTRVMLPEGIRSFMHVPIVLGERVYGTVSVNSPGPRAFGERELTIVTELARYAAGALRHALRFEQERHIAETLQQALIAERLPEMEGLELAALYEPSAGSQVGGDFYSAWPLVDGRLAVLVGDVSGKGVEAAGVTAMVRYMAEALSGWSTAPAELVGRLNGLLCPRMADGSLVTLVLAIIDQRADELRWCVAGHPPPVILGSDGGLRSLDDPDPPCGIFPEQRYREGVERFAPGDALVLYTDGLIEARRAGREFGEDALRRVLLEGARLTPDELTRAAYTAARDWCGGRLGDDVAIAVVRRSAPPARTARGG